MLNKNKRQFGDDITVDKFISMLKTYPQNSKIRICGDTLCYLHIENDESIVYIDNEDLEENY